VKVGCKVEVFSTTAGDWVAAEVEDIVDAEAGLVSTIYEARGKRCRKLVAVGSRNLRCGVPASSVLPAENGTRASSKDMDASTQPTNRRRNRTMSIVADEILAESVAVDSLYSDDLLMPDFLWEQLREELSSVELSMADRTIMSKLFWRAWCAEGFAVGFEEHPQFVVKRLSYCNKRVVTFMVSFSEGGYSNLRAVVKLGFCDDVSDEVIRTKTAARYFQGAAPRVEAYARHDGRGAIRFFVPSQRRQFPRTLEEAFGELPSEALEEVLDAIFEHVPKGSCVYGREVPAEVCEGISLLQYYDIDKLGEAVVDVAEEHRCLGLRCLQQLLTSTASTASLERRLAARGTYWSYIHGDFHCSNMLIDDSWNCFVINFAAFGEGHAVKDVAAMEVSLLLGAISPDFANQMEWFSQAAATVRALACVDFAKEPEAGAPSSVMSPLLLKFWGFVRSMRTMARTAIGQYSLDELRLALFHYSCSMASWTHPKASEMRCKLALVYANSLAAELLKDEGGA